MSIGLGDIFIIFFLLFNIFNSKKLNIDREIFILAILIFLSIFFSVMYNGSYYGLNSLFTIPAKIIVVIIASQLLSSNLDRRYVLLIDIKYLYSYSYNYF